MRGLNGQRLGSFTWSGAGSELRVKNRTLNNKFRGERLEILEQPHSGNPPPATWNRMENLIKNFINTCLPKFIAATSVSGIRGEKIFTGSPRLKFYPLLERHSRREALSHKIWEKKFSEMTSINLYVNK